MKQEKAAFTWEQEQARVNHVTLLTRRRIDTLGKQLTDLRSEVVTLRKHFWDDLTVNLSTPDDVIETAAAVRQQAEGLAERDRYQAMTAEQVKRLEKLEDSPHFGRIDFREDGTTESDSIYIGRHSLRGDDDEFLVYDWRAPISSLYYDHVPGPAFYSFREKRFDGDMSLKRQFVIEHGRIESMFDADEAVGDSLLRQMLGKQASTQMQSIVATIQREQNEAVRDLNSRVLVVQGVAGSGKTSVALQRIAYLLYHFRGMIDTENIFLFSPNPMFSSYIEQVLPDLGEDNLQQTTYQAYMEHRIGQQFTLQTGYESLESMLLETNDDVVNHRLAMIAYKGSEAYRGTIDEYVERMRVQGLKFKSIRLKGNVVIAHGEIEAVFCETDPSWSIPNRLASLGKWLLNRLKEVALAERESLWVEEEIELLDKEDYLRAFQRLRRKKQVGKTSFDDADKEREGLMDYVIARALRPVRRSIERGRFVDFGGMYAALQEEVVEVALLEVCGLSADDSKSAVEQVVAALRRRELPVEDVTPFLYFMESIEGMRRNLTIRHIVLDEVQDYTPLQLAYLKRLFPRSRFTVLGDPNQLIHLHSLRSIDLGDLMSSVFGSDGLKTLNLFTSYRSTAEIVQFSRPILGADTRIDAFIRHGERPRLVRNSDAADLHAAIVDEVQSLQASGIRTIAIVTKTLAESHVAASALAEHMDLQAITPDTVRYHPGVLVIPSYLAKGALNLTR